MGRTSGGITNCGGVFKVHYRKLQEDYTSSESIQKDLFTFSCKACGTMQTFKADDLNSIAGNVFRMAYTSQLKPNFQVIQLEDVEPSSIVWPKQIPTCKIRDLMLGGRSPPGSIPGLWSNSAGSSALSTPSSEESNSPTELNTAKRLGDKPPLIKRLGLGSTPIDENPPRSSNSDGKPGLILTASNPKITDSESHRSGEILKNTSTKRTSGSSTFRPPAPPERIDSLNTKTEEELKTAPWFQAGIPREITLEVLGREPVGSFMVRESTTKPGCYALSLRVPFEFQPIGIAHYLIIRTSKGYKIKGFTKEFTSLTALITHHSVMPELLPCPLSLSRYNPNVSKPDSSKDFADIDSDSDYNTLADFRKMMSDLNV